jgi:spore coat protein CotH
MKRFSTTKMVAVAAVAIFSVLCAGSAQAQIPDWPGIFEPNQLLTLNLSLDPCDWDTVLNNIPEANGCILNEIEVPTLFWADGEESNKILVSVRRKKSFAFPDETDPCKVALKIDINQYVTGQKWHGLNKLSLEANLDSVDLITEGLSVNLCRMGSMIEGFDYPTWYGSWVKVYVNGDYKGVYFNNEQRDKQYMRNHNFYTYHTSWLYKYADCEPGFVLKVGDDLNPASPAVKALCYQPFVNPITADPNLLPPGGECSIPDDNSIIADMNQWVNVRRMLNNAAINSFMANSDDLFNHNNNTYFMDFNDANGTQRIYLGHVLHFNLTDI